MSDTTAHYTPRNGTGPQTSDQPVTTLFRDDDGERVVLASILIDADFAEDALRQLGANDFADGRNRSTFVAMQSLWNNQEPIDTYLVGDELQKRHGWTPEESLAVIDLVQYNVPPTIAAGHIPRLIKYARLREFAQAVPAIIQQAQAGASLEELAALAENLPASFRTAAPTPEDGADELPNPLTVAGAGDALDLGWIDDYARLMTNLTGAPFEFNRLAGLVTAAAAIQRRAWLPMSFGNIYPNIYAAIIARSSVYHKSSALSKPRALLKRAMLDRLLLSELATSEGLLKELAGQGSGVIIRDEIGTLFASHNQKYLATLKPDLTALYDCLPYSRRLSNDAVKVDEPYLNILGATTPTRFYEGVSLTDWQDGFLARWLFVMPEGEPDFDAMTGMYTQQQDAELGRLAVTLVNLDRQPATPFTLAGDAHKLWDDWQRAAAKDAYLYGDDVIAAIVTRYAAYALKFSMILSAVNGSWGTVTADTMRTAIALADSYKAGMSKLLAERNNYGISGAKLQKVFAVIKRKGGEKGATKKTVTQYSNLRAAEARACLEKLLDIGAIVEVDRRFVAVAEQLPIKAWK